MAESTCICCGSGVGSGREQCPRCGQYQRVADQPTWVEARQRFLRMLTGYLPKCVTCGALIFGEEECDLLDAGGLGGEGDLVLRLAYRSEKQPERCILCEDS